MNFFNNIVKKIEYFNGKERKVLPDGTVLIGHAPHIAPHAWIHGIYPVLNDIEISDIESMVKNKIPTSYRNFLLHSSNGLSLFLDTLSLYGLRKKIGRDVENAWQPYSIITPNTIERIGDAKSNHFFIGGYNWDGSLLYIDTKTEKVHRCSNESVSPLNTWDNFEEMITSEVSRIILLFDEDGVEKDSDFPTVPD
jgi:hypothetical protein